jgi:predicted  nucleic acid-binding Zn-ribbon protein
MRRLVMIQDLYKQKRSLEFRWQSEYEQSGKYTLDMVEIDNAIKNIITEIKLEESKIADRENKIRSSAPEVSVAT